MIEIERKFLIKNFDFQKTAIKKEEIVQAYLNSHPERSVRIRIKGEKAFMTIKGKSNKTGLSRFEWEKEIDLREARDLLNLCETGKIEKYRYIVPCGAHFYEVDEFYGENTGLVVAEIELKSENEDFEKPAWLGVEVTGDAKYYNSNLIKKPFKFWEL